MHTHNRNQWCLAEQSTPAAQNFLPMNHEQKSLIKIRQDETITDKL